jgi:hypothetical protein
MATHPPWDAASPMIMGSLFILDHQCTSQLPGNSIRNFNIFPEQEWEYNIVLQIDKQMVKDKIFTCLSTEKEIFLSKGSLSVTNIAQ